MVGYTFLKKYCNFAKGSPNTAVSIAYLIGELNETAKYVFLYTKAFKLVKDNDIIPLLSLRRVSMDFDNMIYGMTTIIEAKIGPYQSQGSGFFFNPLGAKDPTKTEQWREVKGTWLITNRHVALPKINDKEIIPEVFVFNLRQIIDGRVQWLPIQLDKDEYIKRLRVHCDGLIDVATIEVGDLIIEQIKQGVSLVNYVGLTSDNLPENSRLGVNVGDDILVIGYPRGFYDIENKFPIVKAGIVSSKWGNNFNGKPLFLIDSKLFPGSSGSVVLTKPKHFAMIDGKLMKNEVGEYLFLGVYSGEPIRSNAPIELEDMTIIKKDSYNVGNVWYSTLVLQIIENGVQVI